MFAKRPDKKIRVRITTQTSHLLDGEIGVLEILSCPEHTSCLYILHGGLFMMFAKKLKQSTATELCLLRQCLNRQWFMQMIINPSRQVRQPALVCIEFGWVDLLSDFMKKHFKQLIGALQCPLPLSPVELEQHPQAMLNEIWRCQVNHLCIRYHKVRLIKPQIQRPHVTMFNLIVTDTCGDQ